MGDAQSPQGAGEALLGVAPEPDDLEVRRAVAQAKTRLLGTAPAVCIGRYEVRQWLGAGAFGTVYAGYDPTMQRLVAIKVLRRDTSKSVDQWHAQLRREARAQAQVQHRNVAEVLDVGRAGDDAFIVMPYLAGGDVGQWARDDDPDVAEVLQAIVEAGRGLGAAHAAGLVHCDVKPGNLLRGGDGVVKVSDFGLATNDVHATTGGTPRYMAPEQRQRLPFDGRADQFSLAMVAVELLTGAVPPAHQARDARRLPHAMVATLGRALAHEPARRYSSITAFVDALGVASARSRRRWRVGPWIALGVGVAASVAMMPTHNPGGGIDCATLGQLGAGPFVHLAYPEWRPEAREEVRSRFAELSVGDPSYPLAALGKRVDSYLRSWVGTMQAVCAGGPTPPQLDCLQRQRSSALGALRSLHRVPVESLPNAVSWFDELASPRGCTQVTATPDPRDAGAQPQLAQARHLIRESKLREADALLLAVLAGESSVGRWGRAEAQYLRAKISVYLGDGDAAESLFAEAYANGTAAEHEVIAVESALNLAGFASERRDIEAARRWLAIADALVERGGRPPHLEAGWLITAMGIYLVSGESGRAIATGRQAVALLARGDAGPSERAVTAQQGLAVMLLMAQRPAEARDVVETGLATATQLWGPDSVRRAPLLDMLAATYTELGQMDVGLRYATEALALMHKRYGELHQAAVSTQFNLGSHLARAGRTVEAIEVLGSVVDRSEGFAGLLQAKALHALAEALLANGDLNEARLHAARALVEFEARPDVPDAMVDEVRALAASIDDALR